MRGKQVEDEEEKISTFPRIKLMHNQKVRTTNAQKNFFTIFFKPLIFFSLTGVDGTEESGSEETS